MSLVLPLGRETAAAGCGVRQIIGQVKGAVSGTPARAKHLWTGAREPWKTSGTGPGPQLPCHFLPRTCPSA